jgi:hypothetical protein
MGRAGLILLLLGHLLGATAMAQQPETGPGASGGGGEHPVKGPESGTRGPSGTSPDTGYHGPRDVTKDQEPGKPNPRKEMEQSGNTSPRKN